MASRQCFLTAGFADPWKEFGASIPTPPSGPTDSSEARSSLVTGGAVKGFEQRCLMRNLLLLLLDNIYGAVSLCKAQCYLCPQLNFSEVRSAFSIEAWRTPSRSVSQSLILSMNSFSAQISLSCFLLLAIRSPDQHKPCKCLCGVLGQAPVPLRGRGATAKRTTRGGVLGSDV